MIPLRYLFVDMNAYFASCEQADNPRFRGKPLVVRPSPSEYTSAIAVSYEAKAKGIKSFMKIHDIRALYPQIIVCEARHELYVAYHHKILTAIESVLPIDKVLSVDELVCALIGDERTVAGATLLSMKIKARIQEISPALRCSIGIAPSILLAKLATDMMKPNGLVFLHSHELPAKIAHLPLSEISGVGSSMLARLAQAGVMTMQDLWTLDPRHARRIWGNVTGERLWYGLHGHDIRPIETKRSMIGHSRVLAGDQRGRVKARLVMRELVLKAAQRLRREERVCTHFAMSIKLASRNRYGREVNFAATQDSLLLLHQAEKIWAQLVPYVGRDLIMQVSVICHGLQLIENRVGDLFLGNRGEMSEGERLWAAIDKLNQRYGKGQVSLASQRKLRLEYLGAKIAFSRVPSLREMRE